MRYKFWTSSTVILGLISIYALPQYQAAKAGIEPGVEKPTLVVAEPGDSSVEISASAILENGDLFAFSTQDGVPDGEGWRGSGNIYIWNMKRNELATSINIDFWVNTLSFRPDGKAILVGATGIDNAALIGVYDTSTGKVNLAIRNGLSDGCDPENPAKFASSGRKIVSGNGDKFVWDAVTGRGLWRLKCPIDGHFVCPFDVSPDGTTLAVGYMSGQVKVWNLNRKNLGGKINTGEILVDMVRFNNSGKFLATRNLGEEIRLSIWEFPSGKLIRRFDCKDCEGVAFSRNGKLYALPTYVNDGQTEIYIHNFETGNKLMTFKNDDEVVEMTFINDDRTLIAHGYPKMDFWDIDGGKLDYTLLARQDGGWIIYTPEGYFDLSPGQEKSVSWKLGDNIYSAEKYWNEYYKPGLFQSAMTGGKM